LKLDDQPGFFIIASVVADPSKTLRLATLLHE